MSFISKIELITAKVAVEYLFFNNKNRPLNLAKVSRLADDMINKKWSLTHQGIAFNNDGQLIDGQNRLNAVIQAKKLDPNFLGVEMLVTRGVLDDARHVIDIGDKRKPSDILTMEGFSHATRLSALANQIKTYEEMKKGGFQKGQSNWTKYFFDSSELLEFVRQNDLKEYIEFGGKLYERYSFLTQKTWNFMAYLLFKIDKEKAVEFLSTLGNGANLKEGSNILNLRNRLIENKSSKYKFNDFITVIYIIKTWNAHLSNKEIKQLGHSKLDFFPKIDAPNNLDSLS